MPFLRTCLARNTQCNTMSHLTAAGCTRESLDIGMRKHILQSVHAPSDRPKQAWQPWVTWIYHYFYLLLLLLLVVVLVVLVVLFALHAIILIIVIIVIVFIIMMMMIISIVVIILILLLLIIIIPSASLPYRHQRRPLRRFSGDPHGGLMHGQFSRTRSATLRSEGLKIPEPLPTSRIHTKSINK